MKLDDINVGRVNDRRIKLTDDDREQIQRMYKSQRMGVREIAREFEGRCSRRTVQFVLFPERLEEMQKRYKETKHHLKYYNRGKNTHYRKGSREYKRTLLRAGKIGGQTTTCG